MSVNTPSPIMDCALGDEKDRDGRTLVPLAALRLSDAQSNAAGLSGGRKRYRMDEEALRAFKSF